jgi:hypothetical protein
MLGLRHVINSQHHHEFDLQAYHDTALEWLFIYKDLQTSILTHVAKQPSRLSCLLQSNWSKHHPSRGRPDIHHRRTNRNLLFWSICLPRYAGSLEP